MLGLLTKYGEQLSALSLEDIDAIAATFNFKIKATEELKAAAVALMRGKDINTVADLVKSPESVKQLIEFVKNGSGELVEKMIPAEPLSACPNCGALHSVKSADQFGDIRCVECGFHFNLDTEAQLG